MWLGSMFWLKFNIDHCVHLIGTLDLSIICEVVATVAHKWFEIGTQLGVPHHKLKEYEREDDPLSSTFHYLLSNGTVGGAPLTWRHLVEALESDHIGENDLAMFITNKHCTKSKTFSSCLILASYDMIHFFAQLEYSNLLKAQL